MSHYETKYDNMPRWEADDKAIEDLREYAGDRLWKYLREQADASNWRNVLVATSIAGIGGYPTHAFGRRYCLTAYINWMKDDATLDEQGFIKS